MDSKEKHRLLLVEDDNNMGYLVKEMLENNEYEVDLCRDGKEALNHFIKNSYSLCLIDVMLPHLDGYTLAQRIKKLNPETPFMFLTAKSLTDDKIKGFELGADDYLTKPFSVKELKYRVDAIIRRAHGVGEGIDQNTFQLGIITFHYPKRALEVNGETQGISSKEAELLKHFCLHLNQFVSRGHLLKNVWGDDDYFSSKSMDVYISRLRKLLKKDENVQIINIHGKGYRLLAPEQPQ